MAGREAIAFARMGTGRRKQSPCTWQAPGENSLAQGGSHGIVAADSSINSLLDFKIRSTKKLTGSFERRFKVGGGPMVLLLENRTCADLLKVLADQTRLAVVEQLLDGPRH